MNEVKVITGATEDQVWEKVTSDLAGKDILEYNVIIQQEDRAVELIIDIDLGGGFEGGFEITRLFSPLATPGDFRFAIHNEDFLDEIGKFFGMQDVELGYTEFDKKVIVKTNDEERVKRLFSNATYRNLFNKLDSDFTFGITVGNNDRKLELTIEKGITDPQVLRTFYHTFFCLFN